MRATVVGAGIVGLCTAFELAERGAEVTVVDAARAGDAASAGNAGWVTPFLSTPRAAPGAVTDAVRSIIRPGGPARIYPQPTLGFLTWAVRFLRASRPGPHRQATAALQRLAATALEAFDRLADRGVTFEQHHVGLGIVALTDATLRQYEDLLPAMAALGYSGKARVFRGGEVRAFDPAIRDGVAGVIHLLDERHVRPESLSRGLVAALRDRDVTIHQHAAVSRIRPVAKRTATSGASGTWTAETSAGSEIESDVVVVAAGYRSRALLRTIGVDLPLEVARGTSLTAVGRGTVPRHPLKLADHMVACSPFDSGVRLSGTYDVGARSSRINRSRLRSVVRQGLRYLRDWHPTGVQIEWVGHRPTTPDDIPVIGSVPGFSGLFVNTGHGTLGVTLGPTSGALLADEIVFGQRHDVLSPFRITRFRG